MKMIYITILIVYPILLMISSTHGTNFQLLPDLCRNNHIGVGWSFATRQYIIKWEWKLHPWLHFSCYRKMKDEKKWCELCEKKWLKKLNGFLSLSLYWSLKVSSSNPCLISSIGNPVTSSPNEFDTDGHPVSPDYTCPARFDHYFLQNVWS